MRQKLLCWVGGLVLGLGCVTAVTQASEPVAGLDIGAAVPTEKFRRSADVGGAIAPFAGYRFDVLDGFAISLLGQPQLAAFPTDVDREPENDATTIFSLTAGPRFSLLNDRAEVFFSAQGGYYTDITGPLNDDDVGFNISGGVNYEFVHGTALGLFIRRDQAGIRAARSTSEDMTFVTTGLSLTHRFLPPPPVVAAAAPPPPPAPPPPAPPVVQKKIILRGVHFDTDKATIRPDARPILDAAAQTLKENPKVTIAVEGHTDSVASDAYNQRLSMRRAEAVRDYLAGTGIDPKRMTVAGLGESQPVASNDTRDGRAQNRRVELRVTGHPE
ncbi:MAG: OmpA family protein [Candidatus Binatia bacterium]